MTETNATQPAAEIIATLDLARHPEGGWYRETWAADSPSGTRSSGTAIYYLLSAGEVSALHRIDAAEIWHFYAGAPLALGQTETLEGSPQEQILGPDLAAGQRPQLLVPPGVWQTARSLGAWTLVGCTVSPGFLFETFEMAPDA